MKLLFLFIILVTQLTAFAQHEEGTTFELTSSDVEEFIADANNAKKIIADTLYDLPQIKFEDKRDYLVLGIQKAVRTSGKKAFQSYMRYVLNRGLLLQKTLAEEANEDLPGNIQNQISALKISLEMALKLYESDAEFAYQAKKRATPSKITQSEMGLIFVTRFLELSRNTFDASAQYKLTRKSFEFLNWDLAQDQDSITFAETIVDIDKTLAKLTENPLSDKEAIENLRELRRLESRLLPALIERMAQKSQYFQKILEKNKKKKELHTQNICGIEGSIEERIQDCQTLKDSIQDQFVLVIRDEKNNIEILKDTKTNKIWLNPKNVTGNADEMHGFCYSSSRIVYGLEFHWNAPNSQDYLDIYQSGARKIFKEHSTWWSREIDGENYYYKAFSARRGIIGGKFYKNNYAVLCVHKN